MAAAAMSVAAFLAGTEFGRQTPCSQAAFGVSMTLGNGAPHIATALSELRVSQPNCYPYTGGTCGADPCNSERNAQCRNGYCVCDTSCTGVDGNCYQKVYEPVGSAGFTLTNVKFPRQKMYMPATAPMDSIKTTMFPSSMNGGKDRFNLYQLPGNMSGHKGYFLNTIRFSDYVVAIRATAGTAVHPFGAYEVGFEKAFSPQRLALRVCSKGGSKVMLGGNTLVGNMEWLYVPHFTWIVYGYSFGDPGDGGVWKVDPPLHPLVEDSLEKCDFSSS